ncbi:MAG: M81 family metallopeptidase [Alphaproteobacteria bacterium]
MRRVLFGDLNHETNTFSIQPADIKAFEKLFCVYATDVDRRFRDTNFEMAGFIDCAEKFGWNPVHTLVASANPCGKVTDEAWAKLAGTIVKTAETQGPFDGVLLSLHGAMVTETFDDAEGELLTRIRDIVGPDIPIAITLDLHANLSTPMVETANIICSYRTYPHVDMRERGQQAGELLEQAMAKKIIPRTVWAQPPQLLGINGGRSDEGPMVPLLKQARDYETEPGILCVSLNAGFSLADINNVGPSVTVTYDETIAGAAKRAVEITKIVADEIWRTRDIVTNTYFTPEQAAEIALNHEGHGKPLIIADYADNPGAGAYGDSTTLLKALIEAEVMNVAFGSIRDPEAVTVMRTQGEGKEVTLNLGGKTDPSFGGGPLRLTGTVIRLTDGQFTCQGPMYEGIGKTLGPTAVFQVDDIEILVTTNLLQFLDRQMFVANGIIPEDKGVVIVKSMQHFRAAFEPLASRVIVCDGGGLATPTRGKLPFRKVRRPLWPLDLDIQR